MKPRKTRKQLVAERNEAKRNKAKSYMQAAPNIGNLWNAFINWFNGTPRLGGESPYIIGNAPAGGRKLQLLSPLQIKTLLPKDRAVYTNAVNKLTELDAIRLLIKEKANDSRYQEAKDNAAEYWNDFQNGAYDNVGTYNPDYEDAFYIKPARDFDWEIGAWPGVNMKEYAYADGKLPGYDDGRKGRRVRIAPKAEDRYKKSRRIYEDDPYFKSSTKYTNTNSTGVIQDVPYSIIPAIITRSISSDNDTIYRETPEQVRFRLRGLPVTRQASNRDADLEEYRILLNRYNTAWGLAR